MVDTKPKDTKPKRKKRGRKKKTVKKPVEQSIEVVRKRVDESGTKEPSIQRQGEERIVVQLPGIKNPERVKA